MRGGSDVEEIRLGPLSREKTAEQVAALAGGSAPAQFAEDGYARAEGNPFFTEQLVAAALADWAGQAEATEWVFRTSRRADADMGTSPARCPGW